jgi:hypothetical protein
MNFNKVVQPILAVVLYICFGTTALALDVRGKADIPYKSFISSKPSASMRQQGIEEAKQNAWGRYTATFNPAQLASYKAIEAEILQNIDDYIIDFTILDEQVNKDSKVFTVSIRASINEAAFNARLNMEASGGAMGGGELFSYIFVAREVSSLQEFDARKTEVRMNESDMKAEQSGSMSGGQARVSESSMDVSTTTTGGSTLRKADQVTYRIKSSSDVDAAMTDTLSSYGFDVVGYPDVVANCGGVDPSVIDEEFTEADEMTVQTRKSAIDAARACGVNYVAVGTLDIGLGDVDAVTGNKRVFVSVRSQVWDVATRLPRRVASVGPVQFQGLGPDDTVAMRNALIEASQQAASTIVQQLNARAAR